MLHHDVITIVAMFTIVAINHNCRNTNLNCAITTMVAIPITIVAILLNHNCRNANHKCCNCFQNFILSFLISILYNYGILSHFL